MIKRCVTTIAVGKPYYHFLAGNLLKSFLLWNSQNNIHFLLLTDDISHYQQFIRDRKIEIKKITLDEGEASFTAKFKLAEYITADENLFIDCDCLVFKELTSVFNYFANENFSTIGNLISDGEFFCDVSSTTRYFNITAMPKFVGSVYYYRRNIIAQKVFNDAVMLKQKYDELKFARLRGKENEEPLLAIAMMLNNENILANDGTVKADAMFYADIECNVIKGLARLGRPLPEIVLNEIIPPVSMPAIVHFNANFSESSAYKSDSFRLAHLNYNPTILNGIVFFKYKAIDEIKHTFKTVLRPVYRLLFGFRKIKADKRN